MNTKANGRSLDAGALMADTKIAVIGGRDEIPGFKAVGFDAFEAGAHQAASTKTFSAPLAEQAGALQPLITRFASSGYEIIFITETLLAGNIDTDKNPAPLTGLQHSSGSAHPPNFQNPLHSIMKIASDDARPAIIPIPGRAGSAGIGLGAIRDSIIRAAGADIIT